jgi:hypothetical protein
MLARAEKKENVESFVNNCNNRIFLYSDDPWTQEVVNRHEGIMLTPLGPGKAAVVKFNQNLRSHEHGLESLQNAYDACQAKLAEGAALMKANSVDGDASEADRPRPLKISVTKALREALPKCEGKKPEPPAPRSSVRSWDYAPDSEDLDGIFNKLSRVPLLFLEQPLSASNNEDSNWFKSKNDNNDDDWSSVINAWNQNCHQEENHGPYKMLELLKAHCEDLADKYMRLKLSLADMDSNLPSRGRLSPTKTKEVLVWTKRFTVELASLFQSHYHKCLEERCKLGDLLSSGERQELASYAHFAFKRNNEDELERLSKIIPIEPSVALYINERYGKKELLELGFNLTLADSVLEHGWLEKYDGQKRIRMNFEEEEETGISRAREKYRLINLAFRFR